MEQAFLENNFLETSVLISAANYFEDYSDKAHRLFQSGDFIICTTVLEELDSLSSRRIKLYNKILQSNIDSAESVGQFIQRVMNECHIETGHDRESLEQTFEYLLTQLGFDKEHTLSNDELSDFEIKLNEVFSPIKNRLFWMTHSFEDGSYKSKHVIQKYNNSPNHTNLLHYFEKEVSSDRNHHYDLYILASAATHAYKYDLFLNFISNDHIHYQNISKFCKIIDKYYSVIYPQDRRITMTKLSDFTY